LHRLRSDIKPDNAFIDYAGRLILGDFGLAVDGMRLQSTENGSCGTLVCRSTPSPSMRTAAGG
jgi:serine/threonine protein kinase